MLICHPKASVCTRAARFPPQPSVLFSVSYNNVDQVFEVYFWRLFSVNSDQSNVCYTFLLLFISDNSLVTCCSRCSRAALLYYMPSTTNTVHRKYTRGGADGARWESSVGLRVNTVILPCPLLKLHNISKRIV